MTAGASGWTRINAGRLIADKLPPAIQRLLDRGLLSVRIRALRYCEELWDCTMRHASLSVTQFHSVAIYVLQSLRRYYR